MAKIYLDNSKFMEFVDSIATDYTTLNYGANAWKEVQDGLSSRTCVVFSDEAQEYYNEIYDEVESMINNILDVYSINEKIHEEEK